MTPAVTLAIVWAASALMMTLGWLWQRRHENAGIVDVLWAGGLGGSALLAAARGGGALWPRVALAVTGTLWGMRLAAHLWRRVRNSPEDGRYRHLRAHWHGDQRKLFAFFQAQALLIVLFAVPFVVVADNRTTHPRWLLLGAALWIASVLGELVADRQLASFRADERNRERTCRSGLWRYSRHPNYFFEWLHWFTYPGFAVGARFGWLALLGPLAMFVLLRWVSGVPYTEAQALRTRGADYRDYQRRTSMLIPWPPKRVAPERMDS